MRKGVTLLELLCTLVLLVAVSTVTGVLMADLFTDIPRGMRSIETNRRLSAMLDQMRKDMDAAGSLPRAFGDMAAGRGLVLIELPEGVVCYEWEKDRMVRRTIKPEAKGAERRETTWRVPGAKVKWRVWESSGRRCALEVRTWIERPAGGRTVKELANAHVFFANTMPGKRQEE